MVSQAYRHRSLVDGFVADLPQMKGKFMYPKYIQMYPNLGLYPQEM